MQTRPNTPITKVILVAATLALAACSSSTDASGSIEVEESTEVAESTDSAESTEVADGVAESDFLGDYTMDDADYGTQVEVTLEGTSRFITANALPNHDIGEFPNEGNPNTLSAQDVSYEYTTDPIFVGDETEVRTTGVAVNGLKFEPGTAETVTCDVGGVLRVEALQDQFDLGLDFNNAHIQPTGEMHYHGASETHANVYATDEDLVHVGFAADGFLVYYSMSGAYTPSYELVTEARTGTDCVGSGALETTDAVEIEGTSPDGTYTSDWTFNETLGDLDSCNGVEIDGTYAYVLTDSFPYVPRCLNGEATESGGGGGGGGPDDGDGGSDDGDGDGGDRPAREDEG